MQTNVVISGFGGQGVLLAGTVLANAVMIEGNNVTWLPAYGAEMRGGTVNCTVSISDEEVSTIYVKAPKVALALNLPSVIKYEKLLNPNSTLIINSSLVEKRYEIGAIDYVYVPISQIANEIGNEKVINMVALGAYAFITKSVKLESLKMAIKKQFEQNKSELLEINYKALEAGFNCLNKINV